MHWRNSNFQILHFIAGGCHTVDEAYRQLLQLREEREMALTQSKVDSMKWEARLKAMDSWWRRFVPTLRAQDEADRYAAAQGESIRAACISACEQELQFIERCLSVLEPHRKYKHLALIDAHQAAQREEWLCELLVRAENFMLSQGSIPADQLATMRKHPDFELKIRPRLQALVEGASMSSVSGVMALVPELELLANAGNDLSSKQNAGKLLARQ